MTIIYVHKWMKTSGDNTICIEMRILVSIRMFIYILTIRMYAFYKHSLECYAILPLITNTMLYIFVSTMYYILIKNSVCFKGYIFVVNMG